VSAQASDSNFIAFNISFQDKFQRNQNVQSLSEVSPVGKIWDKHRANTDKVLHYYAKANEHYFQQYAWRMRICSELLKFQLMPEESEGILKLKLLDARFCRVRHCPVCHCPVCQWRRSLMWKARAYKILPQVVTDYPKSRWLFVTLTVKNCQIEELRENLDSMNKAFKRFTELKVWPAKGWVKSTEVTKGRGSKRLIINFSFCSCCFLDFQQACQLNVKAQSDSTIEELHKTF